MENMTTVFLNEIDRVRKLDIPEAVMDRARQSLLDYIAVTCAGAHFQKNKLSEYYKFSEPEEGKYVAIGTGKRLVLKEAVFLNGLNGHALDFDDGTNSGIIHLGSPIFSLLIPLAQRYDISVEDMLRAAVVGYEASYTMAVSIQPGHKQLGFHATGTCGMLGATLAAAYMLDFSDEERLFAFSAAAVAASGMLKVLDDGSELKPYNVAKTALLCLTAIQIGKAGFKGSIDPLGGRGFIKMMTGLKQIDFKPVMLNGTYAIMKSYTKPYASCRYTHPSVEAAINIRNKYGLKVSDIKQIDIKTYSLAVPGHDHTDISGAYSAKMSIPYSVAAGMIYGKAGLQEFSEESVKKKDILELTKKVSVTADDILSNAFPGTQTAIMNVVTKEGVITDRVDFPKGEPENPLNADEFRDRYNQLMDYAEVSNDHVENIFNTVYKADVKVNDIIRFL